MAHRNRSAFTNRAGYASASGFTLIELLVVIAIISLLAAILFPVFSQAREKARQSACLSNIKQIGFAISLYQQDYDGTYVPKYPCATFDDSYADHCLSPVRNLDDTITPYVPEWMPSAIAPAGTDYLLRPYVKNDDIRLCPSRRNNSAPGPGMPDDISRYVINGWDSFFGSAVNKPGTSPQGQTDADVPQPSQTMIVWEHNYNTSECQVGQGFEGDRINTEDAPKHWFTGHQGGTNVLWCDGHTRWLLPSQMERRFFTIQQD